MRSLQIPFWRHWKDSRPHVTEEVYEVTFEYVADMNGSLQLLSNFVDSHNGKTLQIFLP